MQEVAMTKKIRVRSKYAPKQVLGTWRGLLRAISKMNEEELKAALDEESAKPDHQRRDDIVRRLHRRYNKIKGQRELKELVQ